MPLLNPVTGTLLPEPQTLRVLYINMCGLCACADAFGAHQGHTLEFVVAIACYYTFFNDGSWLEECAEWKLEWVSKVRV